MVRINIIPPKQLTDQHLIAEYNEIFMLLGFIKKYPKITSQPNEYCLGKGHINFFKNKLKYIETRFEKIKKEMIKRGFNPKKDLNLKPFKNNLKQDWKPKSKDKEIIKKRLIYKINLKPKFYTYYKKHRTKKFLKELLK